MPKARNPNLPAVNGQFIYGSIPIEVFPDGTVAGQIPYWDGVQWHLVRLIGGGGLDLTFDAVAGTLEVYYADNRVYGSFTADMILLKTTAGLFTADAELVV